MKIVSAIMKITNSDNARHTYVRVSNTQHASKQTNYHSCHSGTIINYQLAVPDHFKYGIVLGEFRHAVHRANTKSNKLLSLQLHLFSFKLKKLQFKLK